MKINIGTAQRAEESKHKSVGGRNYTKLGYEAESIKKKRPLDVCLSA